VEAEEFLQRHKSNITAARSLRFFEEDYIFQSILNDLPREQLERIDAAAQG